MVARRWEAGGRAETAEQWLTEALSTASQHRQELAPRRGDPDYVEAALLFWTQPECERLLARWRALTQEYGQSWDEYLVKVQKTFVMWSESSHLRLRLLVGSVEELATHIERNGVDPADIQAHQDYTQELTEPSRQIAWPPGRNDPCWCGAPQRYKKCCLPRARS